MGTLSRFLINWIAPVCFDIKIYCTIIGAVNNEPMKLLDPTQIYLVAILFALR